MKRKTKWTALLAAVLTASTLTSCSLTDRIADGISDKLQRLAAAESGEESPEMPKSMEPAEPSEAPNQPEPTFLPGETGSGAVGGTSSEAPQLRSITVKNAGDRTITQLYAEPMVRCTTGDTPPAERFSEPLEAGESVTLEFPELEEAGAAFQLVMQCGDAMYAQTDFFLQPGDTVYLYRRSDELCAQTADPMVDYSPILTELNLYTLRPDAALSMTEPMREDYRRLIDAILRQEPACTLSGTWEENRIVLSRLGEWRLNFLLASDWLNESDPGTVEFTYAYSAEEQANILAYLTDEILSALNSVITRDMNTLEKVLAVYRYYEYRIEYDSEWVERLAAADDPWSIPDIDIYRGLSTGMGVCHTYAYLCEFALRQLGVECLTLSSDMLDGTSHMWFCVRLDDGHFYHFDPTWENTDSSAGLRYFGMSDTERMAGGVIDYRSSYAFGYGPIVCGSDFFSNLRDVWAWSFGAGHTLRLYCVDIEETVLYDTETGERSVPMASGFSGPKGESSGNGGAGNGIGDWGLGELNPEYEAEQREFLAGTWELYRPELHSAAAWLTLDESGLFSLKIDDSAGRWEWNEEEAEWFRSLPEEGQTFFTSSGTWSLFSAPAGPVLHLSLSESNDKALLGWKNAGDFLYEEITDCDGQKLVRFSQFNDGDSALSLHFPGPSRFEWILAKDEKHPPQEAEEAEQAERRVNETFCARLWKSRYGSEESDEFLIWADDVEALSYDWYGNDEAVCVPYPVSGEGNGENLSLLSGGNDGLFAYGSDENVYRLTTNERGEIIDAVYVPSNSVPDEARAFEILTYYTEALIRQPGTAAVYQDVIQIAGRNALLITVGTDHDEAFSAEVLYGVVELDEVYRYDAVNDEWNRLEQVARG